MDELVINPPAEDEGKTTQEYTREQFESGFRAVNSMFWALRKLDIKELQRWVMIVASGETLGIELNEKQIDGRARVIQLLENLETFKESMKVTGIPPRIPMNVDPNQRPMTPNAAVPSVKPQ
jgi:hypothetical protein